MLSADAIHASIRHGIKGSVGNSGASNNLKGFRKYKKRSIHTTRKSPKSSSKKTLKRIKNDRDAELENSFTISQDEIHRFDIISGRGGHKTKDESHQDYLYTKALYYEQYNQKPHNRADKQWCCDEVIKWVERDQVESNGTTTKGRFLINIYLSPNMYRLMTDQEKQNKIKQALREKRKRPTVVVDVADERDADDSEIAKPNENAHVPDEMMEDPSLTTSQDIVSKSGEHHDNFYSNPLDEPAGTNGVMCVNVIDAPSETMEDPSLTPTIDIVSNSGDDQDDGHRIPMDEATGNNGYNHSPVLWDDSDDDLDDLSGIGLDELTETIVYSRIAAGMRDNPTITQYIENILLDGDGDDRDDFCRMLWDEPDGSWAQNWWSRHPLYETLESEIASVHQEEGESSAECSPPLVSWNNYTDCDSILELIDLMTGVAYDDLNEIFSVFS